MIRIKSGTVVRGGVRFGLQTAAFFVCVLALAGTVRADNPIVSAVSAPEINTGVLGSAMALLTGGFLLLRDRFRS